MGKVAKTNTAKRYQEQLTNYVVFFLFMYICFRFEGQLLL